MRDRLKREPWHSSTSDSDDEATHALRQNRREAGMHGKTLDLAKATAKSKPSMPTNRIRSKPAAKTTKTRKNIKVECAGAALMRCPSPSCGYLVSVDREEVPELKKCPKCKKNSCLRCGAQPYHTGFNCCEPGRRLRCKQPSCREESDGEPRFILEIQKNAAM
jgi:hypothetical protein